VEKVKIRAGVIAGLMVWFVGCAGGSAVTGELSETSAVEEVEVEEEAMGEGKEQAEEEREEEGMQFAVRVVSEEVFECPAEESGPGIVDAPAPLSPDWIPETIEAHRVGIDECLAMAETAGNLMVQIQIERSGRVSAVEILTPGIEETEAGRCLEATLLEVVFPARCPMSPPDVVELEFVVE
jgi:hypothetical protein